MSAAGCGTWNSSHAACPEVHVSPASETDHPPVLDLLALSSDLEEHAGAPRVRRNDLCLDSSGRKNAAGSSPRSVQPAESGHRELCQVGEERLFEPQCAGVVVEDCPATIERRRRAEHRHSWKRVRQPDGIHDSAWHIAERDRRVRDLQGPRRAKWLHEHERQAIRLPRRNLRGDSVGAGAAVSGYQTGDKRRAMVAEDDQHGAIVDAALGERPAERLEQRLSAPSPAASRCRGCIPRSSAAAARRTPGADGGPRDGSSGTPGPSSWLTPAGRRC